MKNKHNEGVISVEATVATVVFLFCMLFFYSFFYITQARNAISHAMVQASQSMSLDAYQAQKMTPNRYALLGANNLGQIINSCLGVAGARNGYVDDRQWFAGSTDLVAEIAKNRFAHYLSGGTDAADQKLKALGVENGLAGMDFSGSYVQGGDLYMIVTYDIEPWYNMFKLKPMHHKLTTCSKLWGAKGASTLVPVPSHTGGGIGG